MKEIVSGVIGSLITALIFFMISKVGEGALIDWLGGAKLVDLKEMEKRIESNFIEVEERITVAMKEPSSSLRLYPVMQTSGELGNHKLCALIQSNEVHYVRNNPNHGSDSYCYLSVDNSVWSLEVSYATCRAVCVD